MLLQNNIDTVEFILFSNNKDLLQRVFKSKFEGEDIEDIEYLDHEYPDEKFVQELFRDFKEGGLRELPFKHKLTIVYPNGAELEEIQENPEWNKICDRAS